MTGQRGMEARKSPRSPCRIESKVRYLNQQVDARVIDISRTGLALQLLGHLAAGTGSVVIIENEALGHVEAIVRWTRAGRVGVMFRQSTNVSAKVAAYFRHYHATPR